MAGRPGVWFAVGVALASAAGAGACGGEAPLASGDADGGGTGSDDSSSPALPDGTVGAADSSGNPSPDGAADTGPRPCSTDVTCGNGAYCDSTGYCKAQKGQGAACNLATDCKGAGTCAVCGSAGGCVDGYCCSAPCSGACQACNLPGKLGVCSTSPAGTPGRGCSSNQTCDGNATTCQSCPATPQAGALHYVDPAGTNDATHGGGYGNCGYKTLTYALTQATGQIALQSGTYSAASGETFPIVLRGTQQLLCMFPPVTSPARIQGKGLDPTDFVNVVIGFHGTENGFFDCVVDGTGTGTGNCVDVVTSGASSAVGHFISNANVGNCGGTAINVDGNVSNVTVTNTAIHDSLGGVLWTGTNTGSALTGNSFSANGSQDIRCTTTDTGVIGSGNIAASDGGKPSCQTCAGCPF